MKLWVSFFVAVVWLTLSSDAGAKVLRRKKDLEFLAKFVEKRRTGNDDESSSEINNEVDLVAAMFTVFRRYPNVDFAELSEAADTMYIKMESENMEVKDLLPDFFSKFGDGSYTEDDKAYFIGLSQVFSTPEFLTFEEELSSKYFAEGKEAELRQAILDVFPALTPDELKSENVLGIMEDRIEAAMNMGGHGRSVSGKRSRGASSGVRANVKDEGKILWETLS